MKFLKRLFAVFCMVLVASCTFATSTTIATAATGNSGMDEFIEDFRVPIYVTETATPYGGVKHNVTYLITYDSAKKTLDFSAEKAPAASRMTYPQHSVDVTMTISLDDISTASIYTSVSQAMSKPSWGLPHANTGRATITVADFDTYTPITFSGPSTQDEQDELNGYFFLTMNVWDSLLYQHTGYSLYDIGFTNYTEKMQGVTRIFGASRYDTSLKIADVMKSSEDMKFDTFIVVSGVNYPDALAGSYIATKLYAPILLIDDKNSGKVVDYIRRNISNDGRVYILGGEAAVSAKVENKLKQVTNTVRIGGMTRYETNLNIISEGLSYVEGGKLDESQVFVCSGTGYADSLSASSSGMPIMIINPSIGLTNEQYAFLRENGANSFLIAGGTGAVPESVEARLKQLGDVERLGGSTRYETSAKIADYFAYPQTPNVVLAYGANFPDGLCAGPLAYFYNANLILCRNENLNPAVQYSNKYHVVGGFVTGGSGLISNTSAKKVFKADYINTYN